MSDAKPREICLCAWLQGLDDGQMAGVVSCFQKEMERRWPETVHTFTEEELTDADGVVKRIAQSQTAVAKAKGEVQ